VAGQALSRNVAAQTLRAGFTLGEADRASVAEKQPLADDRKWPGPDVRERRLFGVSMRTTGFGQGDHRKRHVSAIRGQDQTLPFLGSVLTGP